VPLAHACYPDCSVGRDQEDHGLKPAQANSLQDPISKKPIIKIELVEWFNVKALISSPSTTNKTKQKKKLLW
jgi:hypothetical protein